MSRTPRTPITDDLVAQVLDAMRDGDSLVVALRIAGIPRQTWYDRADNDPELRRRLLRARNRGHETLLDTTIDVAREAKRSGDAVQVSGAKLEIWAIHERAKRMAPHKYGDRQRIRHDVTMRRAEEMTDDELAAVASGAGIATPPSTPGVADAME